MEKVIGILGGMGPEAAADLLYKIIYLTPAEKDQDHIHVIMDCNTKIPDRTDYIVGKGENPLPVLVETALRLQRNGADFIVIPCNTAHYFYDELAKAVQIPIVNMIDEVGKNILTEFGKCKVGLLATMGTYEGRVYEKSLVPMGIDVVVPEDKVKSMVFNLICEVKAGKKEFKNEELNSILNKFRKQGIKTVILGCTELPLVFNSREDEFNDINFISSTDILAIKAVKIVKRSYHYKYKGGKNSDYKII